MENLRMPASYATLPEEELPEIFGGGELGDALDSFTDNLHLDDFFFQGGILSISISFVPLLLFNVVASGYRFVENIYKNLSNWFGYHDDTFSAVSNFTDESARNSSSVVSEPFSL